MGAGVDDWLEVGGSAVVWEADAVDTDPLVRVDEGGNA